MHNAASARPSPGPAPFAADLPPVPAPITAPIDPADVHDAEVQLLRSIIESQQCVLLIVRQYEQELPRSVLAAIDNALHAAELAR